MQDTMGTISVTRRNLVVASAAAATMGAVGVSAARADQPVEQAAAQQPVNCAVVTSDVLVIGGGNMGLHAARTAMRDGRSVTIVDKGVFHHNGVTGMCWEEGNSGAITQAMGWDVLKGMAAFGKALQNAVNYCTEVGDNFDAVVANLGQTFTLRAEDGSVENAHCQFLRHGMDGILCSQLLVADCILITDLFVADGVCHGAIGIDLRSGGYVVFRANATVIASGSCTAMYGWLGTHPLSISTVENTGDIEAAAFRHGMGICCSEFCEFDMEMVTPASIGSTFGMTINIDSREPDALYGVEGDPIFEDPFDPRWGIRDLFTTEIANQLFLHGRATPNGGLMVKVSQEALETGRPFNKRNAEFLKSQFGIDVTAGPIEVVFEMYEKGGFPQVDEHMQTEVAGLFGSRIYRGGGFINFNFFSGTYAGHMAAEYAAGSSAAEAQTAVDWSPVEREIARLEEIRTRKTDAPLRPHEVRHAIQNTVLSSMGLCRRTAEMEATLAELKRIKEEDIPRMVPGDSSTVWNKDWKEAIENYNILDCALLTVEGALLREESRGYVIREEFPVQDDVNWDCVLTAHLVDGETVFEKIYPEKFDASQLVG